MLGIISAAALGYLALGVFVPLFVVGIIMLKSIRRAFVLAIVFAAGATAGSILSALGADWAVGHAVASETRQAMMVAFTSAGAAAGGAIAVWVLFKNKSSSTV